MRPLALAVLLALASPATAQDWQSQTQSRRRSGEDHLRVRVEHAAGIMRVQRAVPGQLYRLAVRYDEDAFRSTIRYVPTASLLDVNLDGQRTGDFDWDTRQQTMQLDLSTEVPLDLAFKFGAAQADLDLGGLNVRQLQVETGASQTRLAFPSPNTGTCRHMDLAVGAAEFVTTRLGNARCTRIEVMAGVGELFLDLTGEYPDEFVGSLSLHLGLGEATIQVPRDMGVRLRMRRFLASVERAGLVREGDFWVTPGWAEAARRLTIDVTAVFGDVNLVRVAEPGT